MYPHGTRQHTALPPEDAQNVPTNSDSLKGKSLLTLALEARLLAAQQQQQQGLYPGSSLVAPPSSPDTSNSNSASSIRSLDATVTGAGEASAAPTHVSHAPHAQALTEPPPNATSASTFSSPRDPNTA